MHSLPSPETKRNHYGALDGWRGICACLVVLFHVQGYSPIYSATLIRNSYLFVDFFFVLSGFVIACNYSSRLDSWQEARRFLILRVGRIYPLHLFMLACFVAYETARWADGLSRPRALPAFAGASEPVAILTNALLVQSLHLHDGLTWNAPSWSISTELWAYVVFALTAAWLGVRNGMLLFTAVAGPILLLYLSPTGMDTTYDWGLVRCLFGFALGVACDRLHRRRVLPLARAGTALMTAAECVVVAGVVGFVSAAGAGAWSIAAPFVFSLAVLMFARERGRVSLILRSPPLTWLGRHSYSIYLTHYFFVQALPSLIKHILRQDPWDPLALPNGQYVLAVGRGELEGTLYYALVLALTLAFSALTYRWVETPAREWSRRWAQRLDVRPTPKAKPAPHPRRRRQAGRSKPIP